MPSKAQTTTKIPTDLVEDAFAASRETVDAVRQASELYLKGYESIGASYFAYMQDIAKKNAEAANAVLSAKTVQDVMDIQTEYAQQRFDGFVAEGTKMSELAVKTATDAFTPLRKRFDDTVAKVVETTTV